MIIEVVHWAALLGALLVSFRYFRDLGDVTQALLTIRRENMLFAIRHEVGMIVSAATAVAIAAALYFWQGAGIGWLFYPSLVASIVMLGFPWVWLHVGLRHQQHTARYYTIDEAKAWVRPEESVIVIEHNGHARAHPDHHIKRPHLAGTLQGLGGENVILTYCCMTHLGLGYEPEIDGQPVELEVIAQHGNNLIMKDKATNEPIQQMYGKRGGDRSGPGMAPWPTFRMTFQGFAKAFPNGEVFLNPIVPFRRNPLLCVFDNVVEAVLLWGTTPHHHTERLLFDTMTVDDNRLPRKTLVWGFNLGGESVAYTEEFVRRHDDVVNATIGGQRVVVAYDPDFESLGVYYGAGDQAVSWVDFWGDSDQGRLRRVENVNAGAYWCVWVNYFPSSHINVMDADTLATDLEAQPREVRERLGAVGL